MDFVAHDQGTQAKVGDTLVGVMRVGDTGERAVAQLMIRSVEGDLVVTGFEGDEIDIPHNGAVVIGPATPPSAGSTRWSIELAHRPRRS